jgi:hypothetical protein
VARKGRLFFCESLEPVTRCRTLIGASFPGKAPNLPRSGGAVFFAEFYH